MTPTLTEQELNAPGGMSTTQGGYMSGMNSYNKVPTPVATPVATPVPRPSVQAGAPAIMDNSPEAIHARRFGLPAPEPTIGETLAGINGTAVANTAPTVGSTLQTPSYDTQPTYESIYGNSKNDARDAERQQRKLFQAEIDATNKIYDDMLNQERLAGQGRLGTTRAIGARGGLLGSDFGEAQRQGQIGANLSAENALQNERAAKIGVIMGTMRKAVADELTEKRAARQQGADNYVKYLADARTRKENNRNLAARAIFDAGLDPATMDPKELEAVGKEAGLSAQEIIMAYNDMKTASDAATAKTALDTRKTEADISKIEADIAKGKLITIGEGTMLYDTETGETFKNPKTYAPGTGSGSSLGLNKDDKLTLLGGGYSEGDIANLESGVREQGLQAIIAQEKAAGATPAQIKALEKAYGSTGEEEQFLTKDYFKSLFGDEALKKSAKEASMVTGGNDWIPFNEAGDTEAYLTSLESMVNLYRQAGYTDQEILKMMQ